MLTNELWQCEQEGESERRKERSRDGERKDILISFYIVTILTYMVK